jgi:hypothetical protein
MGASGAEDARFKTLRTPPHVVATTNSPLFRLSLLYANPRKLYQSRQWPPHQLVSHDSSYPGCHGLSMPSLRFMPPLASTPQRYRQLQ